MTGKDYFVLGCKLFGVYCLVLGIPTLIGTIPTFIQPEQLSDDYRKIMNVSIVVARIIPIVYIVGGFYLIRGGERLHDVAYPEASENSGLQEEKISLFIKMLGLFLIVTYASPLLRTIADYVSYSIAPKIFDMSEQKQRMFVNAAENICGVVFGAYLFRGGSFIVKMCMKNNSKIIEKNLDE